MKNVAFSLAAAVLLCVAAAGEDAPPLPTGLGETESAAPALPPGLGAESDAPALPAGLAEERERAPERAEEETKGLRDRLPLPIYGFWESRAGVRIQKDDAQSKDAILGETRLQLETEKTWNRVTLECTGDVYLDGITEEGEYDLRRLRLTWTPLDSMDVRVGRQVLTWGTGDMLFINDLFPKDWQSFFSGRHVDYLKAPSDALRVGWFSRWVNVDVVYTPQFTPDRYIKGERISYWDPMRQDHSGYNNRVDAAKPDEWFEEDELALRLYRTVGSTEVALYAYSGYWKSPAGQDLVSMQATFPKLRVYGASVRGTVGKGIANAEVGYYDSYEDRAGDDPFVNNGEFRVLVGYERELGKEFTGALQYYLEHMMEYDDYRDARWSFMPKRDEDRHVFTMRLTKLLMNQNLTLSLFTYYSPSDRDAYLRPKVTYKATDQWTLEAGGNVWVGDSDSSFFGQFENNTNVYAGARYAF
ncbi:MAG TPA: hypothetical protein ENN80_08205 [Candidatus Hydrogenedentes bacterium]|nr:hypothetical protein [Candidatus Hydrogenedentota bacterium]